MVIYYSLKGEIMESIKKKTSQTINQVFLSVNLEVPSTIVNVNKRYIQEAIRMIFKDHPQALDVNSPEEVLQKLGISSKKGCSCQQSQIS